MDRRKFILGSSAFVLAPLAGQAQQVRETPRVGYVGNSTLVQEATLVEGFRQGLRERGYIEGKNIVIHYRWAEGKNEAFPTLISELLALNVAVLVTAGTPAAFAAKKATRRFPTRSSLVPTR